MSDRINPMDQRLVATLDTRSSETGTTKAVSVEPTAGGSEAAGKPPAGETVELTTGAKLIAELDASLASVPEIDSARVEAVKAQIENGEYEIDAEQIANALLRTERELGS